MLLEIKGLYKSFHGQQVLKNVDLTVSPGETLYLDAAEEELVLSPLS